MVVINPAERNALGGIKPTFGLTSRSGQVNPLAFPRRGGSTLWVFRSCFATMKALLNMHVSLAAVVSLIIRAG